ATSIVASGATGDPLVHRWVEFGNRLVTVAIFVIAIVVWAAAWRYRPDGRRRADLVWLASAQPAGIVGQAVLGGVVVLTNLDPVWVAFHFVFSMALVAAAVALYVRCAEGRGPARLLVARELRLFAFGAVAVLGVMIVAGTVVTGTGPLAGGRLADGRLIPRFHLPLSGVSQFHADIGWLLAGLAIALVLGLRLTRAPRHAVRLGWVLLALIGAQGAIGYAQYFSGLPAGLVWIHVSDATLIWITAVRLLLALRDRGPLAGGTVAHGTVAQGTVSADCTVSADALVADAGAADPRPALSPDARPRYPRPAVGAPGDQRGGRVARRPWRPRAGDRDRRARCSGQIDDRRGRRRGDRSAAGPYRRFLRSRSPPRARAEWLLRLA